MTTTRPAFRKPWEHGAKAYYEADTFDAAREGFKRKRKTLIFHMPHGSEADSVPCAVCGIPLGEVGKGATKPDINSTWTYSPRHKAVGSGMHYACSWGALFNQIFRAYN